MSTLFTSLLLLLVFAISRFMWDVIKLADYPSWVRVLGLIWLVVSATLAGAVLFTKPKAKETTGQGQSVSTVGSNSPIIQTGNNSPVTFNQGISDADAKRIAETTAEEIKRGLRPEQRTLTPAQAQALHAQLAPLAGQSINVIYIFGNQEAADYSKQIISILNSSGLKLELTGIGMSMPPFYGLTIQVHDSANPPALAISIARAFQISGIPIKGGIDPSIPNNAVHIQIGLAVAHN